MANFLKCSNEIFSNTIENFSPKFSTMAKSSILSHIPEAWFRPRYLGPKNQNNAEKCRCCLITHKMKSMHCTETKSKPSRQLKSFLNILFYNIFSNYCKDSRKCDFFHLLYSIKEGQWFWNWIGYHDKKVVIKQCVFISRFRKWTR